MEYDALFNATLLKKCQHAVEQIGADVELQTRALFTDESRPHLDRLKCGFIAHRQLFGKKMIMSYKE